MLSIITCNYLEQLSCREHIQYSREPGDIYSIVVDEMKGFLFITNPRVKPICSGYDFQTHVWGMDRYTLWILPTDVNKCVFTVDSTITPIVDESIYFIHKSNKNPGSDLDKTRLYISILREKDPNRFNKIYLLDIELGFDIKWYNLITYRDINDLISYFQTIAERYGSSRNLFR